MALEKAPDAFRTISEVSDDLDVPQHVLRFWETRFGQIRPMKRSGGRRFYRPDDIDLLKGIRRLLYAEGYTIRGVQRILKEQGVRAVQTLADSAAMPPPPDARDRKSGQGELRLLGEDGIDVPAPDDEPVVDRTDDLDEDEDAEEGDGEGMPEAAVAAEGDIRTTAPVPAAAREDHVQVARIETPMLSATSAQAERGPAVAPRRPLATPTARADAVSPPGSDAPMTREARLRAILDELLACRAILSAAMEPE